MLKILVDTCVWIDLAKDHHQHAYLRALDQLMTEGKIVVILPPLVLEEFQRNKGNIVGSNTASLSSALKRAKEVLDQHGQGDGKAQALEQLRFVDQRLPRLGDLTGITALVERIMGRAETIQISEAAKLRALERGLAQKAPFAPKKNSTADAMLIEAFAEVSKGKDSRGHQFGFVTHNKNDFSVPNGDERKHHPDFSDIFTKRKIRYFRFLKDALMTVQSNVVEALEFEEYSEQPRPTDEIVALIGELIDKVWYNRHLFFRQQVQEGRETCAPEIMAGAIRSAKKMEQKYGRANLGPYSDFDWGMMNGKLSALRWIFGEDWETTLDT